MPYEMPDIDKLIIAANELGGGLGNDGSQLSRARLLVVQPVAVCHHLEMPPL